MDSRRPWVVDALVGAGVAGTLAAVISARQGGTQQPDAIAYAWAAGLGALMLVRRSHPRVVLLVTSLGLFAYYAAGYPAVGIAVPLAAALFSAAEAGRPVTAIGCAAGVLVVSMTFRLLDGQDVAFVLGYELITHVALMAAAIALGDGLRSRRRVAALAAREERLTIARDLHDSIGHRLAVISLHAEVAREALPAGAGTATDALHRIKDATADTMRELRQAVGVLRADRPVSLSRLGPVLDAARSAGFDVYERIDVTPGALPPPVDAAAYRIVQEAVTNVVRHASSASRVDVVASVSGGRLHLTIRDDGRPPSLKPRDDGRPPSLKPRHDGGPPLVMPHDGGSPVQVQSAGNGIAGMTERAVAVGGTLRARHEPTGFVVEMEAPA